MKVFHSFSQRVKPDVGFFGRPPHQNCVLRYVECHQMYLESGLFGQNSIFDWMGIRLEFILMPKLFSPVFYIGNISLGDLGLSASHHHTYDGI